MACEGCLKETEKIYFHSRCHPKEPTWSYYDKRNKMVVIECSLCKEPIVMIPVTMPDETK